MATLSNPCCLSKPPVLGSQVQRSLLPSSFSRQGGGSVSAVQAALRTGTGFGKRPEQKPKPKILRELEVGKVEKTETHTVFVRKVAGEGAVTKWEKLGEIVIEAGTSVETALKERQASLLAGVKHQYPVLVILGKDEALQFGVRLSQAPKDKPAAAADEEVEGEEKEQQEQAAQESEINALDLSGKQATDETVAAILRVDDGKGSRGGRRRF